MFVPDEFENRPGEGDISVAPLGELVVTTIRRGPGAPPVRFRMEKKEAARYVLMLQTVIRGMNGLDPWPDHPGHPDAP